MTVPSMLNDTYQPLEQLELMTRHEVEKQAAQIDWKRVPETHRPPQEWLDDTDNPFEPEEESR